MMESFKVYKAISEGLINLADKFFEMDYLSAQKGLEIYRQSIMDSERLQVCSCTAPPLQTGVTLSVWGSRT